MISYREALEIIRAKAELNSCNLKTELVSATDAIGRILSEDVIAPTNSPKFSNSAMDGFAVVCSEVNSSPDKALPVVGSTSAGQAQAIHTPASGAWEIMTGAPIPPGYDAVVRIEDTDVEQAFDSSNTTNIRVNSRVCLGDHIRSAGEDFARGEVVLRHGQTVTPWAVMAATSVGANKLKVSPQPKIAIICTGSELANDPDKELEPGQIWNSNGPFLETTIAVTGRKVHSIHSVGDDGKDFAKVLEMVRSEADVIISTGAVSMGKFDFVPAALTQAGAQINFHKVAVRPGKPILYATLDNSTHFLGLAGNPASTAAGFRFFVEPLLRFIEARRCEIPIPLPLSKQFIKSTPLRHFCKAKASINASGSICVEILDGQESFKVSPLLEANGWAVVEENSQQCEIGKVMDFYPAFGETLLSPA